MSTSSELQVSAQYCTCAVCKSTMYKIVKQVILAAGPSVRCDIIQVSNLLYFLWLENVGIWILRMSVAETDDTQYLRMCVQARFPKFVVTWYSVISSAVRYLFISPTGGGISSYAGQLGAAGRSLETCLNQAVKDIPKEKHQLTPLYLGATAGMRLLKWVCDVEL